MARKRSPDEKARIRFSADQMRFGTLHKIGSRQAYKEVRQRYIDDPLLILKKFMEYVTKLPANHPKHPNCWVWTATKYDGSPAVLWDGKGNHNKQPVFGLGKLDKRPQIASGYARRYIYNVKHPDAPLPKGMRCLMSVGCHPLCVNPAKSHMYTNKGVTW